VKQGNQTPKVFEAGPKTPTIFELGTQCNTISEIRNTHLHFVKLLTQTPKFFEATCPKTYNL
jgi:hypothetical protein